MRDGARGFGRGFSGPALLRDTASPTRTHPYGGLTLCAALSQALPVRRADGTSPALQPHGTYAPRFGLVRFRSPLLAESLNCSLLLRVLRCFSSPGSPRAAHAARPRPSRIGGLPHSEIPGSQAARASPELIAARHVLPRLRQPRHPPRALLTLPSSCRTHAHAYVRSANPQSLDASTDTGITYVRALTRTDYLPIVRPCQ